MTAAESSGSPFIDDGEPQLVRCAVLFVDILGVRAMNKSRDAASYLVSLDRAVSRTYRDFLVRRSPWRASFFSDSLVLAAPCHEFKDDAFAVGGLVAQAAILQFNFALKGFFVRGGLSLGDFHIHDGLIFGAALVDAYEIESRVSVSPRIVLDQFADDSKQRFVEDPDNRDAPLAPLMRDGDGRLFVDYLGLQFDDLDSPRLFEFHQAMVTQKLRDSRNDKSVWEKFRWVAEYHNASLDKAPRNFKAKVDVDRLKVPRVDHTWAFRRVAP